jgi:thioredoxin 1
MTHAIIDVKGLDDYIKTIENETKLTIVVFSAEWCKPCQKLSKVLQSIIDTYDDKIIIIKIDVDEDANLSQDQSLKNLFNYTTLPAVHILKNKNILTQSKYKLVGDCGNKLTQLIQELI